MNKQEITDLLIDIEGEIHFRTPGSRKLKEIRALVLGLRSGEFSLDDAYELLPLLEAELAFGGAEQDSYLITRIRSLLTTR